MTSKEKLKLTQLINKTEGINFLSESLQKCELKIECYPNSNTRCSNKTCVYYVFRTNDKDSYDSIEMYKRKLASFCDELLDRDDELPYDEDNEPLIDIKFVDEELDLIPTAPKITFEDCIKIVLKRIEEANISIIGAVAWITNEKIVDALIKKAKQGVVVSFVADNNENNVKFREKDNYKSLPFPIFYVKSLKKNYFGSGIMHHKFAVIDSKVVLYGTFNWSTNAQINDEDIHEDDNKCNIEQYIDEFHKLITEHDCFYDYPLYQIK